MELVSQNKNSLTWQSLRPVLWLFLILATLNLSTGAIIVLVAAGPGGEVLNDASNIPASNIRLLHLELFGGIVHLHPINSGNSNQPAPPQKAISNPVLLRSFDALISGLNAANHHHTESFIFFSQNNTLLAGERHDGYSLKASDKIITSSNSEPGLSRTFSPNLQEPEKNVLSFQFAKISHPLPYKACALADIFLYPPEKPPQPFSITFSA
ncbi:MAG: hypothetical protein J0I20_30070 [Chloroflexi bacterium]|nr:hypothetical protein [Chloroflexota bacterium]OJV99074.1 MAG: hypothetical protein BGO39_16560 [Chloroflexi bacterium 54-19]